MFRNRAVQLTLAKTPKADTPEAPKAHRTLNDSEITVIKDTAKGVGVFLLLSAVTLKFSDAICEIAVNASPKK